MKRTIIAMCSSALLLSSGVVFAQASGAIGTSGSMGSVAARKAGQAKTICKGWLMKPTSKIAGQQTAEFCPNISSVLS
jgi:hypothetical protein